MQIQARGDTDRETIPQIIHDADVRFLYQAGDTATYPIGAFDDTIRRLEAHRVTRACGLFTPKDMDVVPMLLRRAHPRVKITPGVYIPSTDRFQDHVEALAAHDVFAYANINPNSGANYVVPASDHSFADMVDMAAERFKRVTIDFDIPSTGAMTADGRFIDFNREGDVGETAMESILRNANKGTKFILYRGNDTLQFLRRMDRISEEEVHELVDERNILLGTGPGHMMVRPDDDLARGFAEFGHSMVYHATFGFEHLNAGGGPNSDWYSQNIQRINDTIGHHPDIFRENFQRFVGE